MASLSRITFIWSTRTWFLFFLASAAICFEWGRWEPGARGAMVRGMGFPSCGAGGAASKAAKKNQVNNQRNAQAHRITGQRANSWPKQGRNGERRGQRHWGRHPVKVNVTAHLIARTEWIPLRHSAACHAHILPGDFFRLPTNGQANGHTNLAFWPHAGVFGPGEKRQWSK